MSLELVVKKKGRTLPIVQNGQEIGQICSVSCETEDGKKYSLPLWNFQCDDINEGDRISTEIPAENVPIYIIHKK